MIGTGMTKKKSNTSNSKNKVSSAFAPDHITVNGHAYERQSNKSVEVELELEADVLDKLDALVENGTYVSRGDAVRDILRNMIQREQLNK